MKPLLCIVSVYRPDLMTQAARALGGVENVEIIMDRRLGERRQPERASSEETRSKDRRRRSMDELLRAQGFVILHREA